MEPGQQILTLVSKEGDKFKVDKRIINMSGLLKDMLEDNDNIDEELPFDDIHSKFIRDIIEYCSHYNFKHDIKIPQPLPSNQLEQCLQDQWEVEFIQKYSIEDLIIMVEVTNFLNIPTLFELTCAQIACKYKGKSFDSIKKDFGLENEAFTPEEDDALIEEYPWIIDETHRKMKELEGRPPIKKA